MAFAPGGVRSKALAKFEAQAGLADPCLAHQEDHLPVAVLGLRKTVGQEL
jgi:hypothetical protein